jgi:hypothetical protein
MNSVKSYTQTPYYNSDGTNMAQRNIVKCLYSKPRNNKITNIMKMCILMGFDEDV